MISETCNHDRQRWRGIRSRFGPYFRRRGDLALGLEQDFDGGELACLVNGAGIQAEESDAEVCVR